MRHGAGKKVKRDKKIRIANSGDEREVWMNIGKRHVLRGIESNCE